MYYGPWVQPAGTGRWMKGERKGMAGKHVPQGMECARCDKPITRGEPIFIVTKTFMAKGVVPRGRIVYHWECFIATCRSASPLWDAQLAAFIGVEPSQQYQLPLSNGHVHDR